MRKIRRIIFLAFVILLPLNLGKHFVFNYSYISGIIVDYLVPTVYLQDLLAILILLLWFFDINKTKIIVTRNKILIFLLFFVICSFFSLLMSNTPVLSATYFFRLLISSLLCFYVIAEYGNDFSGADLYNTFAIAVIYTSLIGIAQFINQGSVFNNYLILGEQPYTSSNKAILKENVFGNYVIPPYSLFRHPNTFAGFLTLALSFIYITWKNSKNYIYWLAIALGCCCILLSLSAVALLASLLGFLIWLSYAHSKKMYAIIVTSTIFILFFGFIIPVFKNIPNVKDYPSIYRRIELMDNSYKTMPYYIPFGIGLGTSTSLYKHNVFLSRDFSFFQPVHNIFMLITLENGLFSALFLVFVFGYLLRHSKHCLYCLVFCFQVALLGSFDHYLITMHQTLYLFMVLLGISTNDLLAKK